MEQTDGKVSDDARPADDGWWHGVESLSRRRLRIWLYTGAALTFIILIIGGTTRLTRSGLSMVEWKPIVGVLPPLGEVQWGSAFDQYQQFPEYKKLRQGMTLPEFKSIYLWEYAHRMAARTIGLVFLLPFIFFWVRGYLNRPLFKRLLILFALGALQGGMGWFMVKSGLVDDPRVSHYRLAAHLSIAFAIFGTCLWLAAGLGLVRANGTPTAKTLAGALRGLKFLGALLVVQILWGALVAGLDAGCQYNTFPLMGGRLIPAEGLNLTPVWLNPVENPAAVQWIHRVLGALIVFAALVVSLRSSSTDPGFKALGVTFMGAVLVQFVIGVFTLLSFVPVALGVAHQATAMLLFGIWLMWLHRAIRG